MDFGFCGVVDIVLVVLALLMAIIGFKQGFMKKLLSHIGILAIILFSIFFAGQFAQMLIHNEIIYPTLLETFTNNINNAVAQNGIPEGATASEALAQLLAIPGFLADILANGMGNPAVTDLVSTTANYLAELSMNAISFGILFVGLLLVMGILKLIVSGLRKSGLVRFLDGLLGIIYYVALYAIIITVLFYVLSLVMDMEWFAPAKDFLVVDMQLDNPDAFRVSKALYEANFLKRILALFGL